MFVTLSGVEVHTYMTPYINIHTHHLSKEDGVFLFNNRFGFEDEVYTDAYFSAGIHPWDVERDISIRELESLVQHPNCLAIGECGLDKLKGPGISIQENVFTEQLRLALKYHKPVMIHCVKAFDELIAICQPYMNKIPLIIHGYNKSEQLALQLIHQGFYLSLGEPVLNKSGFNFRVLPSEAIFFETDTNNGISIREVYQKASTLFNVPENELKEKIYSNFTALFKTYGR